jgi:hypothetical protein
MGTPVAHTLGKFLMLGEIANKAAEHPERQPDLQPVAPTPINAQKREDKLPALNLRPETTSDWSSRSAVLTGCRFSALQMAIVGATARFTTPCPRSPG